MCSSLDNEESALKIFHRGKEKIRIAVKPEEVDDAGMIVLAKEIAKKIESELEYPGQIKVNIIRETRASATAT